MFIKPDIVETKGIFEIGIFSACNFLPFLVTRIIDCNSFFDGARGIDGVTELSINISFSLTLDELGIEISRLNAKLLIYALKHKAYPHPPITLQEIRNAVDSGLIVVAGGLHPGHSTNGTAALIAEKINASEFLNATDVDGVYDLDPNKYKKAKKFRRIELKTLRNMLVHEDSVAGGYDLMDILALKIIERSKIKTRILKADLKTLEKAIKGGSVGTEIIFPSK